MLGYSLSSKLTVAHRVWPRPTPQASPRYTHHAGSLARWILAPPSGVMATSAGVSAASGLALPHHSPARTPRGRPGVAVALNIRDTWQGRAGPQLREVTLPVPAPRPSQLSRKTTTTTVTVSSKHSCLESLKSTACCAHGHGTPWKIMKATTQEGAENGTNNVNIWNQNSLLQGRWCRC